MAERVRPAERYRLPSRKSKDFPGGMSRASALVQEVFPMQVKMGYTF
jgi:hypothetical protein